MLSGLRKNYDNRHFNRLENELHMHGGETELILVDTKRLETVFDEHNVNHVHYLSIDVEGAEFEVIKSINFDKVFIDVIEFEDNYTDTSPPIVQYLKDRNYEFLSKKEDIFMIHKDSKFRPISLPSNAN